MTQNSDIEEGDKLKVLADGEGLNSVDIENPSQNNVHQGDDSKKDEPKTRLQVFLSSYGFLQEKEAHNAPQLPFYQIFGIFLWFGCRAFGGPVAQIALMKSELVDDKKWISEDLFKKVYAVYQILPGPEATELACYFGYLSGGRFGGFLGGLGFVLPGVLLLYFWSYIYVTFGTSSAIVQASFHALRITVAALIFKGTHKLAETCLVDKKTKSFSWDKGFICAFNFLTSVIGINFFITLAVAGIMNTLFLSKLPFKHYLAYLAAAMTIGFYVLYTQLNGVPSYALVGNTSATNSLRDIFVLGLIAGCVSFGGAYVSLPFVYAQAVTKGGWLTDRQFLDALAITNIMPTPLVSFVTMVGWFGGGPVGSILMTIGIFLPAFSFAIIGHEFFAEFVHNPFIDPFLDGVSGAIIGLLFFTAFQFLTVVQSGIDACVFLLSMAAIFTYKDKYTQPVTILLAAIAGQVLYRTSA